MNPSKTSPTERMAAFVRRMQASKVPRRVRETAKMHILDGVATMLGGVPEEASQKIHGYLNALKGKPEATVLGTALRLPSAHAALANGVQAHVLDYDDAQLATRPNRPFGQQTHPTSPVLAACLALAEKTHCSGLDLLTGYIAGVEVACRLGDAVDPDHYLEGFHPTGTIGVFGATAGCCSLLRLEEEPIRSAFGIAGTLASGLRANRGTMAKALNAGRAAENGVLAALLAREAFSACRGILEDRMGFLRAASRNRFAQECFTFGKPYFFQEPGIAIKRYPCPIVMHPALDLVLELVARHDIKPETVAALRVHMHPAATLPLVYPRPKSGLQGKFSLPFTIALALTDRRVGLDQYTDERVRDRQIRTLMSRVACVCDERLELLGNEGAASIVELVLKNGRAYGGRADRARGHPENPLSREILEEKFQQCAGQAPIGSGDKAKRFLAGLWSLEQLQSIPPWLRLLRTGRRVDATLLRG